MKNKKFNLGPGNTCWPRSDVGGTCPRNHISFLTLFTLEDPGSQRVWFTRPRGGSFHFLWKCWDGSKGWGHRRGRKPFPSSSYGLGWSPETKTARRKTGSHLSSCTSHLTLAWNPRRASHPASLPPSIKNTHAEGQDKGKLFWGSRPDRSIVLSEVHGRLLCTLLGERVWSLQSWRHCH